MLIKQNSGLEYVVGSIRLERFELDQADLEKVIDPENFFSVGTNVDDAMASYLSTYRKICNNLTVPIASENLVYGTRTSGNWRIQTGGKSSVAAIASICTITADKINIIRIKFDHFPTLSSSSIYALDGTIVAVQGSSLDSNEISSGIYIGFNEITKLITYVGETKPTTGKYTYLSIYFSWDYKSTTIKSYENGVYQFNDETTIPIESTYSGLSIQGNDTYVEAPSWTENSSILTAFKVGNIGNTIGPQVESTRLSTSGIYDNQLPEIKVVLNPTNSYYVEAEVYSRV